MTRSTITLLLIAILAIASAAHLALSLEGGGWALAGGSAGEVFLLGAVLVLLVNAPRPWRWVAYAGLALLLAVLVVQHAALWLTGDLLTSTALENARHVNLILTRSTLPATVAPALTLLLILSFLAFLGKPGPWSMAWRFAGLAALAAGACLLTAVLGDRAAAHRSAPLSGIVTAWRETGVPADQDVALDDRERKVAASVGIDFDESAPYPLLRPQIYRRPAPFGQSADGERPPNVILFLSEGLSARALQPYSGAFPDLTPHLERFSRDAMRVDRYYNHTYATYRGLQGQLCSTYPLHAGGRVIEGTDYDCLPGLLSEAGYETWFLFSQAETGTYLDEVLKKTQLRHVLGQEALSRDYLGGEAPLESGVLSDQQFMDAVIAVASERAHAQARGAGPFFLGLYNFETHVYRHLMEDGVAYGTGDSYVLDTIHNWDQAFGRFWDWFRRSDLYGNTVVVFTTDHAHFQGKDWVPLVEDQADYQPLFVDRIPLLIHHPTLNLPEVLDAGNATSIDLAPTLAHLLGLPNRRNAFLGRSLFERDLNRGLAYAEQRVHLVSPRGIRAQRGYRKGEESDENALYRVINAVQRLETEGRIWDPSLAGQEKTR